MLHTKFRENWPIKAKFYVEPPWEGGTEVLEKKIF